MENMKKMATFVHLNEKHKLSEMNQLNVRKIASAVACKAAEVPGLLDREGIGFQKVECVNWAEDYPYKPAVSFRIAYTDDALLIHYRVSEESVRSVAGCDNGKVWEDSCVEFFSVPAADGVYYNMECNCTGRLLVGVGAGRENRQHAPQEVLDRVDRWSSLGTGDFEEKAAPAEWQVALVIPFSTYFLHQITSLAGTEVRANFYKCGDMLSKPHFLSWNPIELPKPNFHVPEFFGMLHFEA